LERCQVKDDVVPEVLPHRRDDDEGEREHGIVEPARLDAEQIVQNLIHAADHATEQEQEDRSRHGCRQSEGPNRKERIGLELLNGIEFTSPLIV
jgi:hypothetical protein